MRIAILGLAGALSVASSASAATAVSAPEVPAIVEAARQRIEASDFRASGRLVRVDAAGKRVSQSIAVAGHWFPGVLRVLVQIAPQKKGAGDAAGGEGAAQDQDQGGGKGQRVSILLEMRPGGQSTIRVFRPHEAEAATLPVEKWGESVADSNFSYEDFLQPEYYWQVQTIVKSAKLGARDCDVLRSAPGGSDRTRYAEVQTWLDRTIAYPVYTEKTPKGGGPVKEFTSLGLSKSGGVWAARQIEVKQHGRPGSTLLLIERGSPKANLQMKDFSPAQISHFEDHP